MRNTSTERQIEGVDNSPRPEQAQGPRSRGCVNCDRRSTDDHHYAALTALVRLLGALAARENVAASCREEGERDEA